MNRARERIGIDTTSVSRRGQQPRSPVLTVGPAAVVPLDTCCYIHVIPGVDTQGGRPFEEHGVDAPRCGASPTAAAAADGRPAVRGRTGSLASAPRDVTLAGVRVIRTAGLIVAAVTLALLMTACAFRSDDGTADGTPSSPDGRGLDISFEGWETDFSTHSVPLAEFQSGGPPRDGIPPIDAPEFVGVGDQPIPPREPVIALRIGDDARAYPLRIMIWHEIVNDTVDGVAGGGDVLPAVQHGAGVRPAHRGPDARLRDDGQPAPERPGDVGPPDGELVAAVHGRGRSSAS